MDIDQDFTDSHDRFKSYMNMNLQNGNQAGKSIGAALESSPNPFSGTNMGVGNRGSVRTVNQTTNQLFQNQSSAAMLPSQYRDIYGDSPTLKTYFPTTGVQAGSQRASFPCNIHGAQYNLTSTPIQNDYQPFYIDPIDYPIANLSPSPTNNNNNNPGTQAAPQSFMDFKKPQPFIMRSPAPPPPYHQPQPQYLPPQDHYMQPNEFPSSFKPRSDANMPHKEKVNDWIRRVPVYYIPNTSYTIEGGQLQTGWYNECYPGVVTASSATYSEEENLQDDVDEEFDMDNVYHTFAYNSTNNNHSLFIGHSGYNGVNFDHPDEIYIDHEDVQEFQARKITKYVKKLYQQDTSEAIVKGSSPIKQSILTDGFDKSNLSQLLEGTEGNPVDITNTSYNLNLTEAIEQINSKRYMNEDIDDLIINNADKEFESKPSQLKAENQTPVQRRKN